MGIDIKWQMKEMNNQINIYIEKRSLKNHKSVNNCYTMISENKSKNKVKLKPILYKSKSTSLIKNKKIKFCKSAIYGKRNN